MTGQSDQQPEQLDQQPSHDEELYQEQVDQLKESVLDSQQEQLEEYFDVSEQEEVETVITQIGSTSEVTMLGIEVAHARERATFADYLRSLE